MRWTFGVEPLAQTERAAERLRRITGLLQAMEHDDPVVEHLIDALAQAEAALAEIVPANPAPRVGLAAEGDGRVYLDHARDIGSFNPSVPQYAITVDDDRAQGSVAFPLAYEGPPGLVHGGFLALFFDCVVQHHNCDVGQAGKTTALALRYRRPVPLLTPLTFTIERSVVDSRIHSVATLRSPDGELCQAEIDAIAGDRSKLPPVSPRRMNP